MFQKIIKYFFLGFVLLLFILSGVFLQTSLILKNTVFSEAYFSQIFDGNHMDQKMVQFATEALANPEQVYQNGQPSKITPEVQKELDIYKKMLKENTDTQWIRVEIPKTIKGLYGYFLSGSGKLPVINIEPVKETYVSLYAQSIIKNSGHDALKQAAKATAAVKKIISKHSKDGTINDQVINEVMKIEPFKAMKLSRQAVENITGKIASSHKPKSDEILKFTVSELVKDRIGYSQIKDELDLNLFFETKYGTKDNPVSGLATLITTIKSRVLFLAITLFILLLSIIGVTVFRVKGFLRWSGAGMILAGIIGMVAYYFTGLVDSRIILKFNGVSEKAKGLDILFTKNWVLSYTSGAWKYIFIYALIFILIGILFITASYFVNRLFNKSWGIPKSLRVAVVLLLLITLPINITLNIYSVKNSVDHYQHTKEIEFNNAETTDKTLGIVLNAQRFLGMMQKVK